MRAFFMAIPQPFRGHIVPPCVLQISPLKMILVTNHYFDYYSQANNRLLSLIDAFLTSAHTLLSVKQIKMIR